MKSLTTALSLALALGVAACAGNPPVAQQDTGNMAYPTPVRQGNIGTATPALSDTGSMNAPTIRSGGVATNPSPGFDTGNMALPNRAQGNSIPR